MSLRQLRRHVGRLAVGFSGHTVSGGRFAGALALVPFRAATEEEAALIMTGHVRVLETIRDAAHQAAAGEMARWL